MSKQKQQQQSNLIERWITISNSSKQKEVEAPLSLSLNDLEIVSNDSLQYSSTLNTFESKGHDRDPPSSMGKADETSNSSDPTNSATSKSCRRYLPAWESRPEAMYKTYVCDEFGNRCEKLSPWLYMKDDAMYCALCERHGKKKNSNGKLNSLSILLKFLV